MKEDFPWEILLHLLEGIRSKPRVLSAYSGQNTLSPRKEFFAACGHKLCETF